MRILNVFLVLLVAVMAEQPPSTSNPIFDCNYVNTATQYLDLIIDDDKVECGSIDGKELKNVRSNKLSAKKGSPTLVLNGAVDTDYYTIALVRPDGWTTEKWIPFLAHLVVNVKGSDLTSDA
jgi:hypothetical protein